LSFTPLHLENETSRTFGSRDNEDFTRGKMQGDSRI